MIHRGSNDLAYVTANAANTSQHLDISWRSASHGETTHLSKPMRSDEWDERGEAHRHGHRTTSGSEPASARERSTSAEASTASAEVSAAEQRQQHARCAPDGAPRQRQSFACGPSWTSRTPSEAETAREPRTSAEVSTSAEPSAAAPKTPERRRTPDEPQHSGATNDSTDGTPSPAPTTGATNADANGRRRRSATSAEAPATLAEPTWRGKERGNDVRSALLALLTTLLLLAQHTIRSQTNYNLARPTTAWPTGPPRGADHHQHPAICTGLASRVTNGTAAGIGTPGDRDQVWHDPQMTLPMGPHPVRTISRNPNPKRPWPNLHTGLEHTQHETAMKQKQTQALGLHLWSTHRNATQMQQPWTNEGEHVQTQKRPPSVQTLTDTFTCCTRRAETDSKPKRNRNETDETKPKRNGHTRPPPNARKLKDPGKRDRHQPSTQTWTAPRLAPARAPGAARPTDGDDATTPRRRCDDAPRPRLARAHPART